ncbi:MAG: N-acetylglucosamine-6-phosphate deacetylase [Verrucomicrobiales bacterium]|nr:N-acetylglucosamine-6-phosphate deacetylase [Verrucomicrobiales bacterium]
MSNRTITGVQLVTPDEEIRSVSIAIDDAGNIFGVSDEHPGGDTIVDGGNRLYALPGFIDIHTHGANGKDLANVTDDAVHTIAEAKLKEGVTTFLPTTWTSSAELLEQMARAAAAYRKDQPFARTPALHIEGPYLNTDQAGAQNPDLMRLPDIAEIEKIHQICPVAIVSLAVELEGGTEFVSAMSKMGIITSAAHSAATMEDFRKARRAGLSHMTHFCNQMSKLHHRDIGLVGAGLLDTDVKLEMICDKIHLCADMIELVFKLHPLDKIMLITDSIGASHLADGEYPQGDGIIIVKDGAARLPKGNLAGSTLQYQLGLKNVAEITGLPLNQVVSATSANQAQSLGLHDRGRIEPGMLGDVVLLNEDFEVEMTIVGGEVKYRR